MWTGILAIFTDVKKMETNMYNYIIYQSFNFLVI